MIYLHIRRFSTVFVNRASKKFEKSLKISKKEAAKEMVRVLNVAEKNDAAKSIADIMSRGGFRKREGLSRFNKIYEFDYNLFNQKTCMSMTSVSGHMLNFEFVGQYRKWLGCNPSSLFDAPVHKSCPEDYTDIKRSLEKEIRGCQTLIIWTDCDREGENIGFEVIQVCQQVKPNIRVLRARFSEITPHAVQRALSNLVEPDKNTSDAVDVRQELDLRIGAAFTRFQTLRLKKVFPEVLADQLISYGSCQFPTLGFVVERYKQVQAFINEPFWKIKVTHQRDDSSVDFNWKRQRLFDQLACLVLFEHCLERPEAKVIDVKSKPKSKWRPVALDTVEMEKIVSRKLKIGAKETMKIAEKLYTQGFISYPRTETNIFPKELDLANMIQQQTNNPQWGAFAQGVLQRGPTPRNGIKSDQAHPPIHPTKYAPNLQDNEKRLYEFIVRHFLACCSQDAQGQETTVEIEINEEKFTATGLMILARNYLEVYPYDKWNAKVIPTYQAGEIFQPTTLEMNEGETTAPPLLTEADLIALMEKHGIGTDATHADHIEKIKSRMYVGVRDDGRFVPGELGMGLVEGYDAMGFEMSKPHLRAELEADLKRICDGVKAKDVVLQEQIQKYKEVFIEAVNQANKIDQALAEYFGNAHEYSEEAYQNVEPVYKCTKCGCDMTLRTKKDGKGYFISCSGYPNCREAVWLPDFVLSATVSNTICNECPAGPRKKIKFKFKKGSVPVYLPLEYEGCLCGCDQSLTDVLQVCSFSTSSNTQTATQTHNRTRKPTTSSQSRSYSTTIQSNTRMPLSHMDNIRSVGHSRDDTSNRGGGNHKPSGHATRGGSVSRGGGYMGQRGSSLSQGGGSFKDRNCGAGDSGVVVCNCGDDGRLLTVRKEGPNTGRQFYACAKPPDAKCSFFVWADESQNNSSTSLKKENTGQERVGGTNYGRWNSNAGSSDLNDPSDDGAVKCNCGTEARSLTVNKDGANKGRPFYGCPKPMGQGCGFFKWGDEPDGGDRVGGGGGCGGREAQPVRGRGAGSSRGGRGSGRKPTAGTGQKRKRHCGQCGEEGHTKKTCPQLK